MMELVVQTENNWLLFIRFHFLPFVNRRGPIGTSLNNLYCGLMQGLRARDGFYTGYFSSFINYELYYNNPVYFFSYCFGWISEVFLQKFCPFVSTSWKLRFELDSFENNIFI